MRNVVENLVALIATLIAAIIDLPFMVGSVIAFAIAWSLQVEHPTDADKEIASYLGIEPWWEV